MNQALSLTTKSGKVQFIITDFDNWGFHTFTKISKSIRVVSTVGYWLIGDFRTNAQLQQSFQRTGLESFYDTQKRPQTVVNLCRAIEELVIRGGIKRAAEVTAVPFLG